jgi:glycerol-3-phosphate dehydrogenase
MAKLAVDRLVERDGREAPCRTHEIPLGEPADPQSLPRVPGVAPEAYEALAARYGHAAENVLRDAADAGPELCEPIVPGMPDLLVETPFSARYEQARSIGDVLLRRTRLGLLAAREVVSEQVTRRVATALGTELGWDEARVAIEVRRFREEATLEGIALEAVR